MGGANAAAAASRAPAPGAAAAFGHLPRAAARSRALPQLAEKTADVAQDTLVELHRQGQQLENAEMGMDQVGGCGDAGADAL